MLTTRATVRSEHDAILADRARAVVESASRGSNRSIMALCVPASCPLRVSWPRLPRGAVLLACAHALDQLPSCPVAQSCHARPLLLPHTCVHTGAAIASSHAIVDVVCVCVCVRARARARVHIHTYMHTQGQLWPTGSVGPGAQGQ